MRSIWKKVGTLAIALAAVIGILSVTASAQNRAVDQGRTAENQVRGESPSVREDFRDSIKQYQGQLEALGKEVDALSKKLQDQSNATVESRKIQVDAVRERLVQLGAQLQPDSPLPQNVDRFQSWIAAQMGRVNALRQNLGVEFVEQLIKRYQQYQQEVTTEREKINGGAKSIDGMLREITTAEFRIAELILAEDTAAAVKELREVVSNINKTIDAMRTQIRARTGNTGV